MKVNKPIRSYLGYVLSFTYYWCILLLFEQLFHGSTNFCVDYHLKFCDCNLFVISSRISILDKLLKENNKRKFTNKATSYYWLVFVIQLSIMKGIYAVASACNAIQKTLIIQKSASDCKISVIRKRVDAQMQIQGTPTKGTWQQGKHMLMIHMTLTTCDIYLNAKCGFVLVFVLYFIQV